MIYSDWRQTCRSCFAAPWRSFRLFDWTCCHGFPFVSNEYSQLEYTGVPGFVITDGPCSVWCCGINICLSYVNPPFGNLVLNISLYVRYGVCFCIYICDTIYWYINTLFHICIIFTSQIIFHFDQDPFYSPFSIGISLSEWYTVHCPSAVHCISQ